MSASLVERIRQSRICSVTVNGHKFGYTRPTDLQMANLFSDSKGNHNKYDIAKQYIFSWDLKESDLINDGSDKQADFSAFEEWLNDARDYWGPLYEAIMTSYVEYSTDRDEAVKN